MMQDDARRARIITLANSWIGTPYRNQASLKGVSADCLGLVRGVWRELLGHEPESAGPYSMDWAESSGSDPLMDAAKRHFIVAQSLREGTVILFRWRENLPAKHLGIYVGGDRFIHAYERHAVIASPLVPQWKKRIAGLFDFPEKTGV
jgi:NlpC/P60 family putative phage cell wall peptidase